MKGILIILSGESNTTEQAGFGLGEERRRVIARKL